MCDFLFKQFLRKFFWQSQLYPPILCTYKLYRFMLLLLNILYIIDVLNIYIVSTHVLINVYLIY